MIDVEPVVYTRVHDAVKAAFPKCSVSDLPPELKSTFPFVIIRETDNRSDWHTLDNDTHEHQAIVVYEIEVYSNRQTGRKAECKKILEVADNEMQSMLFTRIQKHELPSMDRTITRFFARYEAVVDEPEQVGDDTVFQMYRR